MRRDGGMYMVFRSSPAPSRAPFQFQCRRSLMASHTSCADAVSSVLMGTKLRQVRHEVLKGVRLTPTNMSNGKARPTYALPISTAARRCL